MKSDTKWTTTPPLSTGYYWVRLPTRRANIARLENNCGEREWFYCSKDRAHPEKELIEKLIEWWPVRLDEPK